MRFKTLMTLAVCLTLLGATAPITSTQAAEIGEGVELTVSGTSIGQYATVSDGQVRIDMTASNTPAGGGDGVMADAVTDFDSTLVVVNTNEDRAFVSVRDDTEALSFYPGTDSEASIEGEVNQVRLDSGEEQAIGVTVDSTERTEDIDATFTVVARVTETVIQAASIGESDTAEITFPSPADSEGVRTTSTVLPPSVPAGTNVTVEPSQEPTGVAAGTNLQEDAVFLEIDPSNPVNSEVDISVELSESRLSEFTDPVLYHFVGGDWQELSTNVTDGTLTATASGLSPFAVAEAEQETGGGGGGGGTTGGTGTGEQPVELSALGLSTEELTRGDRLSVTVQVTSTAVGNQTEEIELTLDDERLSTRTVTLAEGTTNLTFAEVVVDVPAGAYNLSVSSDAASLETAIQVVEQTTATPTPAVEEPTDVPTDAPSQEETATPGGGGTTDSAPGGPAIALILVALLILVLAGLTAMARR